jgi:FAD/FMN-containing dehydrogenase
MALDAAVLASELTDAIGAGSVLTQASDKAGYETDWRGIVTRQAALVVLPRSAAEVQAVVRICAAHGVPMVPQGGNTSMVAGAVPASDGQEVIVSLRRLDRVRAVDPVNNTMTLEAGVVLDTARSVADDAGRLFPLSLAAGGSCQVGGNIATNAGGVQVLSYGTMRNLVLGLEVVTADGALWDGLRPLRKDNTGIDLKQLFIGSEGILGIITAATVRIVPRPRQTLTMLAAIPDAGAAVALFQRIQERFGADLTSFEFFGSLGLSLARSHMPDMRAPFADDHPTYALIELSALDESRDLASGAEAILAEAIEAASVLDALVAASEAQRRDFWALRENQSEGERAAGGALKHDVAVPITAIAATINAIEADVAGARPGARLNIFGHIGDGNLHVNILPPDGVPLATFIEDADALSDIVYDAVAAGGGTFSAEHGVGQLRKATLAKRRGAHELDMMRAVKRVLDPHGLFNPGKVLD